MSTACLVYPNLLVLSTLIKKVINLFVTETNVRRVKLSSVMA